MKHQDINSNRILSKSKLIVIIIISTLSLTNTTILIAQTFTRITDGVIVNDSMYSMASQWVDYDNDGDLDLSVTNANGQNLLLYRNDSKSLFTRIIIGPGINGRGSAWGDYDNDGDLDFFVAVVDNVNNLLYRNDGNDTFTRITTGVIVNDGGYSYGCSWGDYDNDGDLDLFVANGGFQVSQQNSLYNNKGDGTFIKVTTAGSICTDIGQCISGNWGDYDNDGDLDLFVTTYYTTPTSNNRLYKNNGNGTFTRITSGDIVNVGGAIGSSWGDYDNDGDLDLFMASPGKLLFRNDGDDNFTKIEDAFSGVLKNLYGSSWGDFDNDGDLDLFLAYENDKNFLYSNNGDGTFSSITTGNIVTDISTSHGSSWGDYDNDGDLDLFVANGGVTAEESNFLYANNGNTNHWINIKCIGTVSNSSAIGAKVRVKTTIKGKAFWQLNEISALTGGGFGGQNSLNAEFGLGDATKIDSIKIEWTSGIVQVLINVAVDQFLTITEDQISPVIAHTQIVLAPAGESQIISAAITDNVGIQSATLYYRKGGDSSFASTVMNNISGDTWEGTVPASFITECGTEYYISVSDISGNTATYPESDPQNSPLVIQVTFSNLAFTTSTPAMEYQMISVPVSLDSTSASSILEDDLGNYDDTQWRLLQYTNGTYNEYPNVNNFEPGKGFWLITRESKSLDTGAGKSVTTAQNYQITLQPGWNQIGNPYAFTVNWSDVIKDGEVGSQLVGYSGSSNDESGYDYNRTQLVPFEGYFIKNNSTSETAIEIPPKSASGSSSIAKQATGFPGIENLQDNEWIVRIKAKSGRYVDKDNYIGALNSASNEWDNNDFSEAPFFEDLVSLYFPHFDWESYPGLYTGDFRSVTSGGHYWDFNVKTNSTDSEIKLILTQIQNLPPGWGIILLDRNTQTSLNFLELGKYRYIPVKNETERKFRILVGQTEFIDANDLDLAGIPQDFALSQNYPNPFNSETRMNYELPKVSDVNISIFNLSGQLVKTLFAGPQSAGRYVVSWDGKTRDGSSATSGVYLVRMETGNFMAVKKILLVE